LILVGLLGWCVAPALAQLTELPQQVIEAVQPTPDEVAQIGAYVKARIGEIESGDAARIKRGRDDLQSPATNPGATIAFRTAYSDALVPELTRLGRLDNDVVVINAVQVGGSLATGPAIEFVEKYRADPRQAVRYAAVFALRDTIVLISRVTPVVGPQDVARIVDNLAAGLGTETYADVADMYVRALLEATRVQQSKFEAVPNQAIGHLLRTIGARVRKLGNAPEDRAMLQAVIRASEAVRDAMAREVLDKRRPDDLVRDAGGMGGDLLAYVFRQVRAGNLPIAANADQAMLDQAKAGRQIEMTLTQLGVNIVFSASDRLARGPVTNPPDLAAMIGLATSRGDKDFLTEVGSIIGVGGLLSKPPFNFNPNRFLGNP
jgi:hypothetical protein